MEHIDPKIMRWIYCDIDDTGICWRLAVSRGRYWHFPVEDICEYKFNVESDENCKWVAVGRFPEKYKFWTQEMIDEAKRKGAELFDIGKT